VERHLADPSSGALSPSLIEPALAMAARGGDAALYELYVQRYRRAASPAEKKQLLFALNDFFDPALAARTRELALSEEVIPLYRGWLLAGLLYHREIRNDTWRWLQTSWSAITDRLQPEQQLGLLWGTAAFCDAAHRGEVAAFFTAPEHRIENGGRTTSEVLEQIDLCIALKGRIQGPLEAWLARHEPAGAP
jgi:hypothetical protein